MIVVVAGYSTSVFWGVPLPFKGSRKAEQIITLNSTSVAGVHDRREEIVSRGHGVYRQKASTDARGNAREQGAMQSERCDLCKLMT